MKIGQILAEKNLISGQDLKEALAWQQEHGGRLGSILVDLGFVSDEALAALLSQQLKIDSVQKSDLENISRGILNRIDTTVVDRHKCVPFASDAIAFIDPPELNQKQEIRAAFGGPFRTYIAPETWIQAALERYYAIPREVNMISAQRLQKDVNDSFLSADTHGMRELSAHDFEIESPQSSDPSHKSPKSNLSGAYFSEEAFLISIQSIESPVEAFQLLFRLLHRWVPAIFVFRMQHQKICKPWLVSGAAIHLKDFQQLDETAFNTLSSTLQRFKLQNQCKRLSTDAIFNPKISERIGITPGQDVILFPLFFRDSLQFGIMLNPTSPTNLTDSEIKLCLQAIRKTALAMELLFIQQELAKPFLNGSE